MWFYFEGENESLTDVDKLVQFLQDTHDFLERLVRHGKAFIPELAEGVRRAWNAGAQRFTDLINRTRLLPQEQLERHGLTGEELRLKLSVVAHFFGELISGGGKGVLRKLFDAIDTVLDSILQALAVPGAVKELKDILRLLLVDQLPGPQVP